MQIIAGKRKAQPRIPLRLCAVGRKKPAIGPPGRSTNPMRKRIGIRFAVTDFRIYIIVIFPLRAQARTQTPQHPRAFQNPQRIIPFKFAPIILPKHFQIFLGPGISPHAGRIARKFEPDNVQPKIFPAILAVRRLENLESSGIVRLKFHPDFIFRPGNHRSQKIQNAARIIHHVVFLPIQLDTVQINRFGIRHNSQIRFCRPGRKQVAFLLPVNAAKHGIDAVQFVITISAPHLGTPRFDSSRNT